MVIEVGEEFKRHDATVRKAIAVRAELASARYAAIAAMSIISQLQNIGTEDGAMLGCRLDAEQVVLRLLLWDGRIVSIVFRDWFGLHISSPYFVEVNHGEGNLDVFRSARDPSYLASVLRGEFVTDESLSEAIEKYEAVELTNVELEPYDVAFSIVAAAVEIQFEQRV
jgi:hypothetical protein